MSDDAKPYAVAEVETLPRDKRSGILRQAVRVDHSRLLATVRALEATKEELAHAYSDWEAETKYTAEQKAALDEAVKETNGILRKALSSKAYNAAWGPELEALGDIVDELVLARKAATQRAEAAEAACAELQILARKLADLMPTNGPEEHWAIQESQRRMATVEKRIAALDVGKGWASPEQVERLVAWAAGVPPEDAGNDLTRLVWARLRAEIASVLGGGR